MSTAPAPPASSMLLLRVRRNRAYEEGKQILLELTIVGSLEDRGLIQIGSAELTPADEGGEESGDTSPTARVPKQVVARWGMDPQELGLPVDPSDLEKLRDRMGPVLARAGGVVGGALSQVAQPIASLSSRLTPAINGVAWKLWTAWEGSNLRTLVPHFSMALPTRVAESLHAVCATHLRPDEPLWLEIKRPSSYLPLFPWEQLLRKCITAPVLRLSYHAVSPATPRRALRVAVCVTAASVKRPVPPATLHGILDEIRDGLPPGSTVHLFADRPNYLALREASPPPRAGSETALVLHDPSDRAPASPAADSLRKEHPWGSWILGELGDQSVDLVHWISPGMLGTDRGRLEVLANPAGGSTSPARTRLSLAALTAPLSDDEAIRFVGAEDMHHFLNHVGAWGVVLSSPPDEMSRLGLRFLTDDLARLRPGPCALHEVSDGEPGVLSELYRFLTHPEATRPPCSPRVEVYCHPAETGQSGRLPEGMLTGIPESIRTMLADAGDASGERWVASGQRLVEQNLADWLDLDPSSPLEAAAQQGKERGIEFVSKLLAEATKSTGSQV